MRIFCFNIIVVEFFFFSFSGEHVFVDSSTPILVANQIINAGASKSCMPSSTLNDLCLKNKRQQDNMKYLPVANLLFFFFYNSRDCIWMLIADVVRTMLPSIIPPSYKGSNIRYLYYVRSAITGGWLILENGQSRSEPTKDVTDLVGFAMTYYNCIGMYYAPCYFHAEFSGDFI